MPRPKDVPYSNCNFNNPITRNNLQRAQNDSVDFFLQQKTSPDRLGSHVNSVKHTFTGLSERPSFIVKKNK